MNNFFSYSKDSWLGKNLLRYVVDFDTSININEDCIADVLWIEIATLLEIEMKTLFDPNYLTSKKAELDSDYAKNDWLKLIIKNLGIQQNPITLNGSKAKIFKNRKGLIKIL